MPIHPLRERGRELPSPPNSSPQSPLSPGLPRRLAALRPQPPEPRSAGPAPLHLPLPRPGLPGCGRRGDGSQKSARPAGRRGSPARPSAGRRKLRGPGRGGEGGGGSRRSPRARSCPCGERWVLPLTGLRTRLSAPPPRGEAREQWRRDTPRGRRAGSGGRRRRRRLRSLSGPGGAGTSGGSRPPALGSPHTPALKGPNLQCSPHFFCSVFPCAGGEEKSRSWNPSNNL